jgi:alkylation response protein AidB-like acyl-CoA dehydrogenase
MRLIYDENDKAIAEAARSLLAADPPIAKIRRAGPGDLLPDADRWLHYAEQGWFALAVEEKFGGLGLGIAEQAVLFREVGRALAPGPLVATVIAARAAARAGLADLAADLVAGRTRAAQAVGVSAAVDQNEPVLVVDGVGASVLLVFGPSSLQGFDLTAATAIEVKQPLDPGSRVASYRLASGPPLFDLPDAEGLRADAEVLSAALLSGIADGAVAMSVEYGRLRTQFGKPIGSFQAYAHRCADMATRAEAARCQVLFAAVSRDAGFVDAPFNCRAALALAADGALHNAEDNMRNHGALGMTFDHDAHLFVTRARTVTGALGVRGSWLRALAEVGASTLAGID